MKKQILILPMLILALVFTGCSDDDPVLVNEQEVITTVEVTLTNGTVSYVLSWEDLDGDGPNEAVVLGATIPAGDYNGDIQLYNKTVPEDDEEYVVTVEILEEDLDHQFFFNPINGLDLDGDYNDQDSAGNPIGQQFEITAAASSGDLNIVLLHLPDKNAAGVSDGVIDNAFSDELGTDTDIDISFPITVQ